MRFLSLASSALLAIGHGPVTAAAAKAGENALVKRDEKIAPKFFIISMVCLCLEGSHKSWQC